jgi:hypothetical protein
MKYVFATVIILMVGACVKVDNYDVTSYYEKPEQDSVMASILNYIFIAPPYTLMKDRFEPRHRGFYVGATPRFSFIKYYVDKDGMNYFYVMRPTGNQKEKRGVGGHFKIDSQYHLTDFREVFVTPQLPESEVRGRCAFLFDEMVKGDVEKYLVMPSYAQWPNEVSFYDTVTYEWKFKPGLYGK